MAYTVDFAALPSLLFSRLRQIMKKIIPYTVVIGVASPTRNRDVSGSRDIRMDTGIRIRNAEEIPCSITGMLLPIPLKYPMLLNSTQVRIHSAENPRR